MSRFNTSLVAVFLSAAMLFPSMVQAMQIQQFDKMTNDDQAEYVSELISGAEKMLTDEGKADQAKKVEGLFTTNAPDGNTSIGMSQFMLDVAKARLADVTRAANDLNAHRLEVEDAMLVTLKRNDIPVSPEFVKAFRAVNSGFKPKTTPKENAADAAKTSDTEKVKALLAQGGDVNAKDKDGHTLLHVAANDNAKDAAALLLANGADMNAKDSDGWTPLHRAAGRNAKDVAELLLGKGADMNAQDKDGATPLSTATTSNAKDVAALLLAKGANVNAKTNNGWPPLHWAAAVNAKDVAALLLANGAEVDAKNDEGWTSLHMAADKNSKDVAALLLAKGADVNARNAASATPLHVAALVNAKEVAALLLASGADVNAKTNKSGETPLDWAVQEHSDAVADLLRAPAVPAPSATKPPPDASDDPIGAGGFIQPPPANKGN